MTHKQRILSIYHNETPDVVPFMLDLSHWFYHKNKFPWDLSISYDKPEYELIDYHKKHNIGFYIPNLGSFYKTEFPPDVIPEVVKIQKDNKIEIIWSFLLL